MSTLPTMYDAANPAGIPPDAKVVAGYINGAYKWTPQDWARFPNATKVQIQVYIPGEPVTNAGDVLDVEADDAGSPAAQAAMVQWVREREKAGITPTIYTSASTRPELEAALKKAGVSKGVDWWVADYKNTPFSEPGAAATQYEDYDNKYDKSTVTKGWLNTINKNHKHEGGTTGTTGSDPGTTTKGTKGTSKRKPSKKVVMEASEMQAVVAALKTGEADLKSLATTVDSIKTELGIKNPDSSVSDDITSANKLVSEVDDLVKKLQASLPTQADLVEKTRRDLLGIDQNKGPGSKPPKTSSGKPLAPVGKGKYLGKDAAAAWKKLEAAAKKAGITIPVTSGYKPYGKGVTNGVVKGALGVAGEAHPVSKKHPTKKHDPGTKKHDPGTKKHDPGTKHQSPGSHNVAGTASHLYHQQGADIGNSASQELTHGSLIGQQGANLDAVKGQLQKGDLLFYRNGNGPIHVAVYLGNGKVLDRGGPGQAASVHPLTSTVLGSHFLEARRYVPDANPDPAQAAQNNGTGVQTGVTPGSPAANWLKAHAGQYGFHPDGTPGNYSFTPPAHHHAPAPKPHNPAPKKSPGVRSPTVG